MNKKRNNSKKEKLNSFDENNRNRIEKQKNDHAHTHNKSPGNYFSLYTKLRREKKEGVREIIIIIIINN